jgi:two-component system, OmpR family, sensor kinase
MGKGRRRVQLRTRVLAGVLAVTLLAFVAFDLVAVTQLRQYLLGRTDSTLSAVLRLSASHLVHLVRQAKAGRPSPVLQAGQDSYVYDFLAFVPDRGSVVVLGGDPGLVPRLPGDLGALAASRGAETVSAPHGQGQLRLRARTAHGGDLVVTASLAELDRTVGRLELIVVVGSTAALALIAAGVVAVVRRGLRPLEVMANQADRINTGELTQRVGPDDTRSEVGRLAMALNGMLARIESSVEESEANRERMRRFFTDASHELRTPIASLRANAELYRQGALPDRAQVDETMRRIELEAQRMSRLVDDMLRLARLDQVPLRFATRVDLSDLVGACVERARAEHPERWWDLDVTPGLSVIGDPELLRRAVDNLIANVHTHTPAGTAAWASVQASGSSVVVAVADDGPGVPDDRLSTIFERFNRAGAPSSRSGSGLGLAIVQETVAAHEGSVTATRNGRRGLRVSMSLPRFRSATPDPSVGDDPATRPPPSHQSWSTPSGIPSTSTGITYHDSFPGQAP